MNTNARPPVIAVAGPTASGKTELSVALALELGGEVVSCDSVQIYRGLDIGSAKSTPRERRGVSHFMIDVADPRDSYSCADYVAEASAAVEAIYARGNIPIVCGGTGLYMDNLLRGTAMAPVGADPDFRERMSHIPPEELYRRLESIDPDAAAATHCNNVPRVVRALEIYELTGVTKSEWDARSKLAPPRYKAVTVGLFCSDRELHYRKMNDRVGVMLDAGLEAEVRALYESGALVPGSQAGAAIGYAEMLEYIEGRMTLDEAAEAIRRETRRYAKRQMTWFRKNEQIVWFDIADVLRGREPFSEVVKKVLNMPANDFPR